MPNNFIVKLFHVIVAYNSPNDLLKLFKQIALQNEEQHHIILIDNSSNNYKSQNLHILSQLDKSFVLNYFHSNENLGSAKGFAFGMQKAYDMKADWIWLHDHDGYPLDNCLSEFNKQLSDKYLMAPQVVDENDQYLGVFNGKYDSNDNIQFISLTNEVNCSDVAATAGLLINRKIIETIGVYDYKSYFVGMEDFDFCLRAKSAGYQVSIIRDAKYFHPNKWPNAQRDYQSKNLFIGEYQSDKTKGGAIHYRILYFRNFFVISFFYSLIYLLVKLILWKKLNFIKTIRVYFRALACRFLKAQKIFMNSNEYEQGSLLKNNKL